MYIFSVFFFLLDQEMLQRNGFIWQNYFRDLMESLSFVSAFSSAEPRKGGHLLVVLQKDPKPWSSTASIQIRANPAVC